jgi:putative tryptophan/tyrosine transport system substrate-binding protein
MHNSPVAWLFIALLLTSTDSTDAQQTTKMPRIGYVSGTGDAVNQGPYVEALRQGLRDLGYTEGKNMLIEYRGAEGKSDRIPALAAELIQLQVDIIIAPILPVILAVKERTKTIPIVMVTNIDPVERMLVASLARPGGNITGLSTLAQDLNNKRLGLLMEVVPRLSRVAVLKDADSQASGIYFKEYEAAAHALKVHLLSTDVRGPNLDLETAFQTAIKSRAGAIITITNNNLFLQQKRIADLAVKNRLPSMFQGSWRSDVLLD